MMAPTAQLAGWSGVVGGLLWAVTPLRQPVFGAGRTPDEGELFFRSYNLVLVVIAALLTVALLRLRRHLPSRASVVGWWVVLVGHALLALGSLPAVLLGDQARPLVSGGQDLGFLGAMAAALGALVLGVATLRRRDLPATASWLLLLTLPLGVLTTVLLTAVGVPEDYLGLPLTVLYGGAWIVLGWAWIRGRDAVRASSPAASGP